MKRILLSFVAFATFAMGASAAAEPTYTATGSVGKVESYETDPDYSVNTTFPEVKGITVEVYGTDSIVVRNWCGVEGYDMCVTRDADGNATGAWRQVDGVAQPNSSGYHYNVETGLKSPNPALMQAYMEKGYCYAYSYDEIMSGYVEIFCHTYDDLSFSNGVWSYYFLGWGDCEPSVSDGIKSPASALSDKNAPAYNLAGQKAGSGYKGIVIQNGKKIIRK